MYIALLPSLVVLVVLFDNNTHTLIYIYSGIPPPAPTEFICTGITSTTATVSWLPSRDDLQYKLSWQKTSSVLVNSTRLPSDRTSYMIINLDPGTSYRLMINSINTENKKESLTIFITMKTLVAGS